MQKSNTTTSNLRPNTASALCYLPFIGWVAAIVLVIVEKEKIVRWNAVQALILSAVITLAVYLVRVFASLFLVGGMVVQLVLTVKAFNNETVRLPVFADWADKLLKKL